ncbi:class I SAM-dependent methyltransferase [Uliginosibacterium sp. H3]|uniref:Class I SAM-dependent methyltransferase n=1 Tax=Uliginosibacterium silvisoli TaxID=3114758 RepID=A0ABU6K1B6_9RHOO|nr:class I SAM-dependent methyltransferase [Uliginosibacterium sp. H3]
MTVEPGMKYHASINLAEKNSSHTLAYDMVQAHARGRALRVLEVGCASGYWGEVLKAAGHSVVGVEPDPVAATAAQTLLDQVFVGFADDYFASHPDERFDVISFVDVLEHTANPEVVLDVCRSRLKPGGVVVASIPNVAHVAVRGMLLAGKWDYAKTGIMDNSHIRFFTRNTIVELFSATAFRILDFRPTTMRGGEAVRRYGLYSPFLFRVVIGLLAPDREWRNFQYIVCATPAESGDTFRANNLRFADHPGFFQALFFKADILRRTIILEIKLKLSRLISK